MEGETRLCPQCKETIMKGARRCKHCNADLRNWFVKHKILTGVLVLLVVAITMGSGGSSSTTRSNSKTSKEEIKQSTTQSGSGNESVTRILTELTPTEEPGTVEVKSHRKKVEYGYPKIVGEVVNNTRKPVSWVKVTATFYDENGEVVATDFTYVGDTDETPLQPGATGPFEITDTSKSVFDSYKLDVTWR